MNSNGIMDLRKRLSKNLKRLIRNPAIEEKELAAFDLIMNRRQFLKAAQLTAIGALVASAYPPTAWGRYDQDLYVSPKDVGLTVSDQTKTITATQLVSGTELFQDTIYAQPVVSQEGFESHGLVEGAKGWSRLQSDLSSTNPDESQFLDTGFHFGPPELIQIEQDSNGKWEVVHYRHPWTAQTSGVRTSGLVRDIIMTEADGLDSPEKVIPVTGTFTNYFVSAGADQQSYITYAVFIQQSSGNHYIAIGTGLLKVSPPYDTLPEYPVQWTYRPLSDFGPKSSDTLQFTDKYTESVWQSDFDAGNPDALTQYDPRQSHEHILLYYNDKIIIISILDSGGKADPNLTVSKLPYPSSTEDARVIHIDWDYNDVDNVSNWRVLKNVMVARSESTSDGGVSYKFYSMQRGGPTSGGTDVHTFSTGITWVKVDYDNKWKKGEVNVPANLLQDGTLTVDYSNLRSVNGLYTLVLGGDSYYVKLANVSGHGIFALTIWETTDSSGDTYPKLFGHFPLAFPDSSGLGTINTFFGGTSKFGGLRFVAGDADGNLFLMRQRSADTTSTPYAPPIYGLYGADGTPLTTIDTEQDELPSGTASTSNLHDLNSWMLASVPTSNAYWLEYSFNMLLQVALAFGTDSNNLAQAVWLGNGYQAAYAAKRFGLDSEHVVVRQIQNDGTDIYSSIAMFKNPVDKSWRQRVIASQTLPTDPGENETGDHYQATITPANAYGVAVSLADAPNTNLRIEVRADSPCTVTDDTHNLYYNVDRYTSFMTTPDPASGQLRLVVKADVFSQVLYVRLVDSSALQRSTDSAMFNALSGDIYPWQSLNLAAQAQQRMGNDGTTSNQPGDSAALVDTTVYISADTLSQSSSNKQNPWQTKGNYQPTTDNLSSLGSYLNTSGQNLISATGQLSLGAAADGITIDPLYAVTAVPSDPTRNTVTTQFAYDSGTVTTTTSAPSAAFRRFRGRTSAPGGAFGSVSHALHDALHWLQHAEAKFYNDLSSGGVSIASAAEGITVTIGRDIMKQVNGVEQDLNDVVTTVEEYASIVVNVVVTIVEESFIYQFIELLIALISLFLYFGDILDLSNSLKSFIEGLPKTNSTYPLAPVDTGYPWQDKLTGYVGSPNSVGTDTSQANTDAVVDEVVDGLLNAVLKNPLTRKLLDEVVSAISRAINALDTTSPVQFNMDTSIVDEQIQLFEDFSNDVDNLFVNVTDDVVNSMVNQVVADIENPPQTYTNFTSALDQLMAQVETDAMDSVYTALGQLTATDTSLIGEIMTQSDFLELHIPLLADLFRLFKIGDVSGNKVTVNSGDAISFLLALIIWTAIYMATGKSIDDINNLIPSSPSALAAPLTGTSNDDKLTFAYSVVAAGLMTINGAIWSFMQTEAPSQRTTGPLRSLNLLGELANLGRWTMGTVKTAIEWDTQQVSVNWTKGYLPVFTFCRTVTGITSFGAKSLSKNSILFAITALNAFLNLVAIAWSVADGVTNDTSGNETLGEENWAILVGDDIGRGAAFFKLVYAWKFGTDATYAQGEDSLELFSACVTGLPLAGFGAAAEATGFEKLGATAPPDAVKQLLYQVDALNIMLPKRAEYRLKTRLIRDLRRALLAYAQGDLQNSVFYLVNVGRTVESLKYGGRITSSVADILITQIQNILAYIGIKGGKISKGGLSLIGSRAYNRRRRPSYRGR